MAAAWLEQRARLEFPLLPRDQARERLAEMAARLQKGGGGAGKRKNA
jgi:hypothetical protein